jgi:hypothetical protein
MSARRNIARRNRTKIDSCPDVQFGGVRVPVTSLTAEAPTGDAPARPSPEVEIAALPTFRTQGPKGQIKTGGRPSSLCQ